MSGVPAPAPPLRRRIAADPMLLAVPGLAFLAVFFLYPVLRLLLLSVQDPASHAFSMVAYARTVHTGVYARVLGITFAIAGETTLLCLLLGYPLAYWIAGLGGRWRGRALLLVMVPFWTSSLVKTFSWLLILGREGVLNRLLLGAGRVELLHDRVGVMIGMVHAMLPLAVLTMLPVMAAIDRRLPRAAQTLGAHPAQAFWRVFFHLSMPGVAAAGLLVFISSLGFFITPALLGGPRDTMLAQLIITQIQEMLDWGFAGALAAVMVAAALVTCLIYDRLFGLSSVSGGEGGGREPGWTRRAGILVLGGLADAATWLARAAAALPGRPRFGWLLPAFSGLLLAYLVLPTLVVLPIAFTSSAFLSFPPPGYGLHWMRVYLASPVWVGATIRSFGIAFVTGLAATALAACAAFALARSDSRWKGAVFALFLAPMIIPRIVIALALFYLFAQMSLVATDTGLAIGHVVLALPLSFVTLLAVLKGYDWRLDQAAATLGANRPRALLRVTLPLIRGGLVAAFLFAFITSFDELTVALFVSGGVTTTLPKQMWDDMVLQLNPTLAAVSAVVFVVISTLLLLAERFRRPD